MTYSRQGDQITVEMTVDDYEELLHDARRSGRTIPFADLLIGATALHFGYAVGARNLRHFRMIPDLPIVQI